MEETTTDTVEVPSSPEDAEHRKLFYEAVNKHLIGKDDSAKSFLDGAYQLRFDILKKAKEGVNLTKLKKISGQTAKFKAKFDIISVGSISKLVYKEKADSNGVLPPIKNYKEVSRYSAIFHAIKKEHLPMHRKWLSLFEEVKSKFAIEFLCGPVLLLAMTSSLGLCCFWKFIDRIVSLLYKLRSLLTLY